MTQYIEIEKKIGTSTLRIHGDVEYIKEALKELEGVDLAVATQDPKVEETTSEITVSTDYPQLAGVKGVTEALTVLSKSDWLKTPRTVNEINEVLKVNVLHYHINRLYDRLGKMTKQGVFRRVKEKGSFRYTPGPKAL